MNLETDADRLQMILALGAGATLTYGSVCYDVIFDNDYVLAGEVEERAPMAQMRSIDVACAKFDKDAVVEVFNPFDGSRKNYRVRTLQPDGTGMTQVVLKVA